MASEEGSYFDRGIKENVWPEGVSPLEGFKAKEGGEGAAGSDPSRWLEFVDPWNDDFEAAVDQYIAGDWSAAAVRPGPTPRLVKPDRETDACLVLGSGWPAYLPG